MADLYDKLDLDQLRVAKKVKEHASQQGLDPELALAAFYQESGLRQSAKSKTGPVGVAQLGKAAAKETGVNRHDEDQNILGGIKYLKQQLENNNGDYRAALIDYHDGPGTAKRNKMSIPAMEHADAVLGHFTNLGGTLPTPAAPAASKEVPPVPVVKSTEPSSTDVADTGEYLSVEDIAAGVAGGVGGAMLSPHKKKPAAEVANELAAQRTARQGVRDTNKSLAQLHQDEMARYKDALEMRKNAIEAVKARQAGTPLDVYTEKMVPGGSANIITSDPTVVSQAGVQQKIPQVQQNMNRAVAIDPMAANIDVNRGGLSVPFSVAKAPPPPSVESMFPMPQRPVLTQQAVPPLKPIYRGSNVGRVGTSLGTGMAAAEASNALTRAESGDVVGAGLGAISAAGGAGTHLRNPKAALASGVVGGGAAAAQQLYDYLRNKEQQSVLNKAEGGLARLPKFAGRGEQLVKAAVKKGEELIGREPLGLFVPRPTRVTTMSEALGPHEGKYLGLTQTDNFGVHGTRMGGNQFPNFQNINPLHQRAGIVWMNDAEKHANDLVKNRRFNNKDVVYSTYIGGPDQLKSNKTVTNDILDAHYNRNLTPEQIELINNRIATAKDSKGRLIFPQAFDIRDRFATQELGTDTFARRSALASMLGEGEGVGRTKQGIALPQYQDILRSHRDPLTEGVPTSSVGTRIFTVDDRPAMFTQEFHPDYNWGVFGKDQQVQFPPVPQRLAVHDWHSKYKERFPTKEPHGNAWFSYPKDPQFIDEAYLTRLQKEGYAQGGLTGYAGKGESLVRAGKEGLERFLAPSQEQRRLYHGTRADIKGFRPHDAVFLSPDPKFANRFAAQTDDPKVGEAVGPNPKIVEGANVMPVHVQATNIYDPLNEKQSEAMRAHLLNKHKDIFEQQDVRRMMAESADKYENWRQMEHPLMQGGLKDLGHDAFYVNERGVRNLGVYDPKRIKSAIGNQGTYDTSVNDLTKAEGGLVHLQSGGNPKLAALKGLVAPAVDRINMHFKDVTKRIPQLTDAAQRMKNGEPVTREEYEMLVNAYKPVKPFSFVPQPATREEAIGALHADKRELYGTPSKVLQPGQNVGLRLDIPAYSDHGVWVPAVHEKGTKAGAGTRVGYESVASVRDPVFNMSDKGALGIASGKPKSTIATIEGGWNPVNQQEAIANAQRYLEHPEWRQVGMDPERHGYFYDRASMEPVLSAEEALQIGPLVLARKPVYGKKDDFKFAKGGLTGLYANIHAKQERIKHGSGEKMRKPGDPGAPTAEAFRESEKTAKLKEGGTPSLAVGRGEKLSTEQGAGLTAKGRAKYNRETGSNLKAPQPEGGPRKDSFCARMQGVVDHAKGDAPRAKASLKRWKC